MKNGGVLIVALLFVIVAIKVYGADKVKEFFSSLSPANLFKSKPSLQNTVLGAQNGIDLWTNQTTEDMGQQMLDNGAGLDFAGPYQIAEVPMQTLGNLPSY